MTKTEPVYLLDSSALIPLVTAEHEHRGRVTKWFSAQRPAFATCPITEGALLRHYYRVQTGANAEGARQVLSLVHSVRGHQFWPDALPCSEVSLRTILGHRMVTDVYLAGLAKSRGGVLATLDEAHAIVDPDVLLVPT